MRTVTGTFATACALPAALLVAGCGGSGGQDTKSSGEVLLQPVAARGPDPFTHSTVVSTATPSPVSPLTTGPATPATSPGATDETGPRTVPDAPDLPGGGRIPDNTTSRSIFDSPTGVFDG